MAARRLAVTAALLGSALAVAPAPLPARAGSGVTPDKGAQVYCFMRSNGNAHEVSWTAAYALIKRQNSSLFKTSPEHAAVMITEAVVQNPETYPDCGRFLGDLYGDPPAGSTSSASLGTTAGSDSISGGSGNRGDGMGGTTRGERYGY